MTRKKGLNLCQSIEGMTIVFDPETAGDLEAIIQFDFTGEEPGRYHLSIAGGECVFHHDKADAPSLTISAPSQVWMEVIAGELDGAEAMAQGLYKAEGDLELLLKMDTLFRAPEEGEDIITAPPGQRPPGPLRLKGSLWMTAAFIPWMIFWFTFPVSSISRWVSVGVPFFLSLAIVAYRLKYGPPTRFEYVGFAFFALAGIAVLLELRGFNEWGTEISQAVMGGIWLGTLFTDVPLSADYIKWGFKKVMWRNTLFIHPNAVISLMWGWVFIATSLLGVAAEVWASIMVPLTIIRYGLLVPGFAFTAYYPRGAPTRRFVWERSLRKIRLAAGAGLAVVAFILVLLLLNIPSVD